MEECAAGTASQGERALCLREEERPAVQDLRGKVGGRKTSEVGGLRQKIKHEHDS